MKTTKLVWLLLLAIVFAGCGMKYLETEVRVNLEQSETKLDMSCFVKKNGKELEDKTVLSALQKCTILAGSDMPAPTVIKKITRPPMDATSTSTPEKKETPPLDKDKKSKTPKGKGSGLLEEELPDSEEPKMEAKKMWYELDICSPQSFTVQEGVVIGCVPEKPENKNVMVGYRKPPEHWYRIPGTMYITPDLDRSCFFRLTVNARQVHLYEEINDSTPRMYFANSEYVWVRVPTGKEAIFQLQCLRQSTDSTGNTVLIPAEIVSKIATPSPRDQSSIINWQ